MKLPKDIKGRHKVRDAEICLLWDRDDMEINVIAEKTKLTERRIRQILRTNHAFIPIDKEWEKRKRIRRLQNEIKSKPKSAKDVADLLEQLRREIEGDKPLIHQESHVHYTIEVQDVKSDGRKENTVRFTPQPESGLAG